MTDKTYIKADIDAAYDGGYDDGYDDARMDNRNDTSHIEAAIQAINEIRRGAYADAITTLERQFLPKWVDKADCEAQYKLALG